MPLYWLCYRHNNQISVVIEPGDGPCDCQGWSTASHRPHPHGRLRCGFLWLRLRRPRTL